MKFSFSISFILLFCLYSSQSPTRKNIEDLKSSLKRLNSSINFQEKDTLILLTQIYDDSRELNYKEGQLKALDYRSDILYNTGRLKEALTDIDMGLKLAQNLNDYYQLANLMCGKGFCYTKLGIYHKSMNFYNEGLRYSEKIADKNKYHYARLNLYSGMMHNANNSKNYGDDLVIEYAKNAFEEAKLLDSDFENSYGWLVQAGSNLAVVMLMSDKGFVKSEVSLIEVSASISKVSDKRFLISYYQTKGFFEYEKKNYLKSIEYYQKAGKFSKDYKMVDELQFVYKKLSQNYKALHDFKNSLNYLEKSKILSDSLNNVGNKTVELSYEKEVDNKNNNFKYIYYLIGIILFLVVKIIIFFQYLKYKKIKADHLKIKIQSKEHEAVKLTLEHDNKVPSFTNLDLVQMVKENNYAFYSNFQQAFPDFIQKLLLIDKDLKVDDLEFCALLKLNSTTKTIAIFKNISVRAVESKKYRLRKRFDIGSKVEFYTFFNTL